MSTEDAIQKYHVHGDDGAHVDANECLLSAAVKTASSLRYNWAQYRNNSVLHQLLIVFATSNNMFLTPVVVPVAPVARR